MACFLVLTAEAVVTTVAEKVIAKTPHLRQNLTVQAQKRFPKLRSLCQRSLSGLTIWHGEDALYLLSSMYGMERSFRGFLS